MSLKKFIPSLQHLPKVDFEYQFTVFVPVYNAANTISRVFNALQKQSFKNFEVIIINDGSTDSTHEIISELLRTCSLQTVYINNDINKHKMGCLFEAITLARGEFFLVLDADDECTENALEVFFNEYNQIPEEKKSMISGVTCCCVDQNGNLVGDYFPETPFYSDSFRKKVYNNIKGEKWGFVKTTILSRIDINHEVFSKGLIPESYIWFLIAKEGYLTKYINNTLRVYHLQIGGNLSSLGYDKKAFGMAIFAIAFVNWFHKGHLIKVPSHFFMRLYSLLKASKFLSFRLTDYLVSIDNYLLKFAFALFWPIRRLL